MKRRRARLTFVLFGVLVVLGLFVLDDVAAGATLFAAMLVFIFACIFALAGLDEGVRGSESDRTGLAGWFGGWF